MAESLESVRRRIGSVEDLRSIVRTMKALAAANIRQYERAARAVAQQAETVETGFHAFLVHHPRVEAGPRPPESGRTALLVLGSDQGMCGSFNEKLARFVVEHSRDEERQDEGPLLAVGNRITGRLEHLGPEPEETLPAPGGLAGVTPLVERILLRIDRWLAAGRFDRLVVFHNHRLRGTASRPRRVHLYPISDRWLRELQRRPWPERGLPIFKMPWRELLSSLTHELLFVSLYRAVVESLESENASRLEAMQVAERNVDERLDQLEREFRQERQSSIDAELLDIISGYEATSGRDTRGGSGEDGRCTG